LRHKLPAKYDWDPNFSISDRERCEKGLVAREWPKKGKEKGLSPPFVRRRVHLP